MGRFVSADTLVPDPGDPQALNRLAYTLGNPLIHRDPSGHVVERTGGISGKPQPLIIFIRGIRQTEPYPPAGVDLRGSLQSAGHRNTYIAPSIYTGRNHGSDGWGTLIDVINVMWEHNNSRRDYWGAFELRTPVRKIIGDLEKTLKANSLDLYPGADVILVAHSGGAPVANVVGRYLEDKHQAHITRIVTFGSILVDEEEAANIADQVLILGAKNDPLGYSEFVEAGLTGSPDNVTYEWTGRGGHGGYGGSAAVLDSLRRNLGLWYLKP